MGQHSFKKVLRADPEISKWCICPKWRIFWEISIVTFFSIHCYLSIHKLLNFCPKLGLNCSFALQRGFSEKFQIRNFGPLITPGETKFQKKSLEHILRYKVTQFFEQIRPKFTKKGSLCMFHIFVLKIFYYGSIFVLLILIIC